MRVRAVFRGGGKPAPRFTVTNRIRYHPGRADQGNTSTAKGADAGSTYAAAMFAVDAVHQDGTWKIASIDTFG